VNDDQDYCSGSRVEFDKWMELAAESISTVNSQSGGLLGAASFPNGIL
jgi:hypothetical protein